MPKNKSTSLVPYSQSNDLVALSIKQELELIQDPILARKVRGHAQDIYELSKGRFEEETKAASFATGAIQLFHEYPKRVGSAMLLRKYPEFSTLKIDSVLRLATEVDISFENALEWLKLHEIDLNDFNDEIDSAIFATETILSSFPKKVPGMTNFNNFDRLIYAYNLGEERMHRPSLTQLAEFCEGLGSDGWWS
jgi:hypothetical protein